LASSIKGGEEGKKFFKKDMGGERQIRWDMKKYSHQIRGFEKETS